MRFLSLTFSCAVAAILVSGCLVAPVENSGGIGSVTVSNSNPTAIVEAAQAAFAQAGYQVGPSNFPASVSFDKGSNKFANVMWGSYGDPQTIRVRVKIAQIPGTNDYRISPKVYSVSDAGEAGFDDPRPLAGLWAAEFGPTLRRVAAQAANAGPMAD
jgi:hypothetical protein